jgi:formylglycine-generating enzyme required for sulfatase activity
MEPKMVKIIHQKLEKSMTIEMVHLPSGKFTMGEEGKQKKVVIDYEFELGKYAVTIEEYMAFVEDTDTHYPEWLEKDSQYNLETGSDDHYKNINQNPKAPIVGISWHNAVAYCKWLREKSNQNYRLPTETEWEYACRAGTTTTWSFGDDEKELDKYAWYDENSYDLGEEHEDYGTHVVGEKLPNPWGLFDMHGNVWEWCEDWYDKDEDSKVLRGGSWLSYAYNSRSAYRVSGYPTYGNSSRGFRLLRTLP